LLLNAVQRYCFFSVVPNFFVPFLFVTTFLPLIGDVLQSVPADYHWL